MRKQWGIALGAVIFSAALSSTAFAGGWQQTDGKRWSYQYDDGTYAKGGIRPISGINYAFDSEGYMMTGWLNIDGWKFFEASGEQRYGWLHWQGPEDKEMYWYYLNPKEDGKMQKSLYYLEDKKQRDGYALYYFGQDGKMKTGNFEVEEGESGAWIQYITNENGVIRRNEYEKKMVKVDGKDIEIEYRYDEAGLVEFRTEKTKKAARHNNNTQDPDGWQTLLGPRETARLKALQTTSTDQDSDDNEDN